MKQPEMRNLLVDAVNEECKDELIPPDLIKRTGWDLIKRLRCTHPEVNQIGGKVKCTHCGAEAFI